jgi:hypothetical protein
MVVYDSRPFEFIANCRAGARLSMETLAIFLATGAVAGLLAGLFGVGGGLIMVPALAIVLPMIGAPADVYMQMAIGTSLAVIGATSISSTISHHRRDGVVWPIFWRVAPGLVLGALLGAGIADQLSAVTLQRTVGIGALLVAIQMAFRLKPPASEDARAPHPVELLLVGTIIGMLSSLIGIGGGSLTVPLLSACRVEMRQAVGTAAACGLPIAWAGALGFVLMGRDVPGRPADALGYISLTGFFSLAAASVLLAPLGARLAHRLPARALKRGFAVLLCAIGLKMLLG